MNEILKPFRVGYYVDGGRTEQYAYHDDGEKAYDDFITRRAAGEVWLDKAVGDEYETIESYDPDADQSVEEKYLQDPGKCPVCGSTDISAGHMEVDGSSAWAPVSCSNCSSTWQDVYELTGTDNLVDNSKKEVEDGH